MSAARARVVEVRDVTKVYGAGAAAVAALRGISLALEEGELVAVRGPSGSGKSTLLHLLGGLEAPTSGTLLVDGAPWQGLRDAEAARRRRRTVGFVLQSFALVPALSALENAALPLLLDGVAPARALARARERLEAVGLLARAAHGPSALSGGEQQRVAVARALVASPRLVLADEPTGSLDWEAGSAVLEALRRAALDEGRTVLLVTHDARAAAFATRSVELRDGRVDGEARAEPHGAAPGPLHPSARSPGSASSSGSSSWSGARGAGGVGGAGGAAPGGSR